MTRLAQRMQRLEARWRPKRIAAILRRSRQCTPADRGAFLLAELTTVESATALAIMDQLTEAELDALIGPEVGAFMDTLPASELEALIRGDPAAIQRCQRSFQRWRNDRP